MLFALWGGSLYRGTRDLDFTGYGSSESDAVIASVREICAVLVANDGLAYDIATVAAEPIRETGEYNGLRVRLMATLAGARIPMQIDIGFGNAVEPPPAEADYPTLLDMPAPRIRAYPHEAVVAEKFHAMTVLGELNSRYKDFYDIHVLASQFGLDGERLAHAIAATFDRRRTPIATMLPVALTPRFYSDDRRAEQWRAYLTRNRLPSAAAEWGTAGELVRSFLEPPWLALALGLTFADTWPAGDLGRPTSRSRNQNEQHLSGKPSGVGNGRLTRRPSLAGGSRCAPGAGAPVQAVPGL